MFKQANHVHSKFHLSSFYSNEYRQNFDIFLREIQNFPEKLLDELPKFKKSIKYAYLRLN
jgi:hypothetical protein